jgi:hypothetical protein
MATTRRTRKTTTTTEPAVTPDTATVNPAPDEQSTTDTRDTTTEPDSGTTTEPGSDPTPDPAPTSAPAEPTPDVSADAAAPVSAVPVSGAPVSGIPVSGVPTSGAPLGSADHMKIVMVAGVLGDHPEGVSAATVVDESGLRATIVGRVLAAMETAGAAVRKPAGDGDQPGAESGVELWLRGDADLTTVDLTVAAVREVCPTCQRPMPRRTGVNTRRTVSTAPGTNGDGQPTLGKGQLEAMVREFLTTHSGHEFSAGTIAKELARSSGAVGNALAKLVITGAAVLTNDAPMRYTAPTNDTTTSGAAVAAEAK